MSVRVLSSVLAAAVTLLAAATDAQNVDRNVNMVSGTRWPKGDPFLQRQNEPSAAVSTRSVLRLVAGANDYRTVDLPGLPNEEVVGDAWLGLFKSFDGGQTWRSTLLPGYPQDQSAQGLLSPLKGYTAGADPTVRAGTNGLFYYSGIVFGRQETDPGAVFVARLIDNNDSEGGDPIHYLGATVVQRDAKKKRFLDKPWLGVDVARAGAGTCTVDGQTFPAGNVYLTYSLFVGDLTPKSPDDPTKINSRIMFARSTDCGVTWSAPLAIQERHPLAQGTAIAIDPADGTVYVAWRQFKPQFHPERDTDAIWMTKSADGGSTFSPAIKIADIQSFDQGSSAVTFRTNSYPAIVVDDAHRVHVAWSQRGVGPAGAAAAAATLPPGDARIVVTTSTDRGATWPVPSPADNPPIGSAADCGPGHPNPDCRGHQVMPSLTFGAGKLMLLFYDLRLDHTVGFQEPIPEQPGHTAEKREAAGIDAPEQVFTTTIQDAGLTRRHTLDVRVAQAIPADHLQFDPSRAVSQYVYGNVRGAKGEKQRVQQLEFNVPNLPLFAQGTTPFIGDYIDIAPAPAFLPVPGTQQWIYNTSASNPLVMHAVWTDNRDVRPPSDGKSWANYVAPKLTGGTSLFDPTQEFVACEDTDSEHSRNTGMRNQNIYTARITDGLFVSSPQNSKPLGQTVLADGRRVLLQRAFVVQVQNATREERAYRLTIADPQPVGGRASFLQFGHEPLTSLDVNIPARSSVSRSVYVTSSDRHAPVRVDVAELAAPAKKGTHPDVKAGGLKGSLVFNADATNPDVKNPDVFNADATNLAPSALTIANPDVYNADVTNKVVLNPDVYNPDVYNPDVFNAEVYNSEVSNPDVYNPDVYNPDVYNPDVYNPDVFNPDVYNANPTNVRVENPDVVNMDAVNPDVYNPDVYNPDVFNPDVYNASLRDVTWKITNRGNTAASYSVKMLLRQAKLPADFRLRQMVLYKGYVTPVALGCDLHIETQNVVLANIPLNPAVPDANLTNPDVYNSDPTDPDVTNATVTLSPGESAYVALRISDNNPTNAVGFETLDVKQTVAPAVAPEAVPTEEAVKIQEADVAPPAPAAALPPTWADLSISDAEVVEGDAGATATAVFTVALSTASSDTVSVKYATADGTAVAGTDYVATSGTLTFAPGDTTGRIEVPVTGDGQSEPNETFFVNLSDPQNITIADKNGIGTIRNDDSVVSVQDAAPLTEGNSGQTTAAFVVTLSEPSATPVNVEYSTSNGTAAAGTDYVAQAGTLTFAPGETSQVIAVTVNGDTVAEPDETFFVSLFNAVNSTFGKREAVAVIRNDDAPPPSLSIADVRVAEGNSGLTPAVFTVTLSPSSTQTVTVDFATADGTTTEGFDYAATSGTLTFPPGTTTQRITVQVFGDTLAGPDQTFFVKLSNPINAALVDPEAVGTIANDDAAGIAIGDVSMVEGDAGTRNAVFTVTLGGPSAKTVTVDYATANGPPPDGAQGGTQAGSDFVAASGKLSFPAGTTTRTITVVVNSDTTVERDETFRVNLSNPSNATLTRNFAVGTIENDDFPPLPRLSIGDATVVEGDTGNTNAVFTVRLSASSAQAVTVRFDTVHGTAAAGTDYLSTTGTLTFAPGVVEQALAVPVVGDTNAEPAETFFVRLVEDADPARLSPTNAVIVDAEGVATIVNDDIDLSVDRVSVVEGASGTTNAVFTVRLSSAADHVVTVDFETADWTALAPGDYTAQSGTLVFLPGSTAQTFSVPVVGDAVEELDEVFYVNLANAAGARIAEARGVGTIVNDDDPALPSVSVGDVAVVEGNSGTTSAVFTVQVCGAAIPGNPCPASARPVAVDFTTVDDTAEGGSDYEVNTGTLTFAPGETRKTVTVTVFGETTSEPSETFILRLGTTTNAVLARTQAIGTIQNDDPAPSLSIADLSVTEGDTGTSDAVFTATLSAPSSQTITVHAETSDGTATAGFDYVTTAATLTFDPGQTTQTFAIPVKGDLVDEPNETFNVTLSNAAGALLGTAAAVGTIVDNDAAGASLSIADVTVVEGTSGTSNAVFTVTLSAAVNQTVTVAYATADASATAPADYAAKSGTLTFPAGTTSQTITVQVNGDLLSESDEQFFVNLSSPVRATLARPQGVGTIADDDGAFAWGANESGQIGDGTTTERGLPVGVAGLTQVAGLAGGAAHTLAVAADGSVHAWGSNSHGQLGDGSTLDRTAPVGASGLTDAVAVAAGAAHSYALRSDGRVSAWGRGDAGQLGHGGTTDRLTPATIPSLSGVVAIASGANHGLALLSDATLKAWGDNQRGQLGDGTQDNGLSPVAVIGLDNLTAVAAGSGHSLAVQGDGTVWAWGRNDGGQLGDGTTTDSAVPVRVIGLDDVRAVAAGGMTSVALRADGSVWVWGGGSAKIPVRVEGFGGAVAIAAGLDHRLALKADRTVWAWGANDFGQLGDGSGANQPTPVPVTGLATTAAIAAGSRHSLAVTAPLPSLSVSDVSISEGNTGAASVAFNVTLSAARPQPVTVRFLTADGPAPAGARAGSDYQATSGTLVFPPGTTTQTVVVPVYGDTLAESDETFSLNLLSPRGAALAEAQGIATVVDNDPPGLSIEDLSVIEGNSGTKTVSANVRLSSPSTHTVTVSFQTASGTAAAGADYVNELGTLTFDPGVVGVAIDLPVVGDTAVEPNETFFVRLSNPVGAVLENTQATVTIVNDDTATAGQAIGLIADDDPMPLLTIDDLVVSEGETAQFTVKLVRANGHPAPSSQPVTVHYATADGTARAGTDYQPAFGTLTFAPGVTSQTVGVVVNTDATGEGEEIFFVNLTSPAGARIRDEQGIGTIRP